MSRSVREVCVQGVEKRKYPNKHYVYIIQVTWTTGATNKIYRRYSQFFEFQLALLSQFPLQGGKKNPEDRIIPFLPGKILFGRSHIRGVAEQRMGPIMEYLEKLISLPTELSASQTVTNFFEPTDEDIKPTREKAKSIRETEAQNISDPILLEQWVAIGDFERTKRAECSLKEGDVVDVVEKKASGWWFIENAGSQGWAPAAYLEPVTGGQEDEVEKCAPGEEEEYITNNSYIAQSGDELTFERGVIILVLQKNYDGWWLCRYQRREALVPAAYLEMNTQDLSRAGKTSTLPTSVSLNLADNKADKFANSAKNYKSVDIGGAKVPSGLGNAISATPFIPRRQSIRQVSIRKRSDRESLGTGDKRIPEHKIDEFVATGDYDSQDRDGLSFREGDVVEIVEKHDTGWWWGNLKGQQGWVPSTYLEKKEVQKYAKQPSPQMKAHRNSLLGKKPKRCTSSGRFMGQTKDTLSFKAGDCFDILEKSETGWWYLKNASGQEGWAPDNLLVEGQDLKPTRPTPISPTKPTQKFPANSATDSKPSLPLNKSFNGDFKAQLKPVTPFKPVQPDKPVFQNKPVITGKLDKPVLPTKQDTATKPDKPTQNNLKPLMPTKPSSYAKIKIDNGVADTSKPIPPIKPRPNISESKSTGNFVDSELSGVLAKRLQATYQPTAPNKPGKPARPVSQEISSFKPVLPTHSKTSEPTKPVLPSRPSRPSATPSVATQSSNSYVTIDDNRAYDEGCLSFRKGESAELVEKGADGWWWMKIRKDEGWVLDSKVKFQADRIVAKQTGSIALSDFKAEHEDSISVRQGDRIQIVAVDNGSGWTWVRVGKEEGWLPTDLIKNS